jgi:hypothetical protein
MRLFILIISLLFLVPIAYSLAADIWRQACGRGMKYLKSNEFPKGFVPVCGASAGVHFIANRFNGKTLNMGQQVILLNLSDPEQQNNLRNIIREETEALLDNYSKKEFIEKTFSFEQARKIMRIAHRKVKQLVEDGTLKVAQDNKILGSSIDAYFKSQNNGR